MTTDRRNSDSRAQLAALYRDTLLEDVIPFWLRHLTMNLGFFQSTPSIS